MFGFGDPKVDKYIKSVCKNIGFKKKTYFDRPGDWCYVDRENMIYKVYKDDLNRLYSFMQVCEDDPDIYESIAVYYFSNSFYIEDDFKWEVFKDISGIDLSEYIE